MAVTNKQWRRELAKVVAGEGGTNCAIEHTGGTHLAVTADYPMPDGKTHTITMYCSLSPSTHRAALHVRTTLRKMVRETRERHHA